MRSSYFTRHQVVEVLDIEVDFLVALERESIVAADAPSDVAGEFSERMLDRIRVAHNLVRDLEVNLAGAAIIVRMREEMVGERLRWEAFLRDLEERVRGG